MSKAENQTNSSPESVNSVNSTAAGQVNLSSYDMPNESIVPVIVPASQIENQEVIDCATFSNGFEASENCLVALAPSQKLEIVTLIQALSSSNSNLIERVTQLEQALTECLKALQSHKKHSRVTESMLTQKTQELAAAQEQIKYLSEKTAASHQTVQRQQTLIESLTAQLQGSQERFAQLEWEHYLTQASCKEQSEQLIQTESTCRELRTRLNRQQHYTLQLKVALEKCLEAPVSSYESEVDIDSIPTHAKSGQGRSIQLQSFFSKVQPIKTWSAQPQFLTDELEPAWAKSSHLPDIQTEYYQSSILDWSNKDLSTRVAAKSTLVIETDEPEPALGEQHDAVLDVCERSSFPPPAELIEHTTDSPDRFSSEDITKPEEGQWQELQDLLNMFETAEEVTATISASAQLAEPLNESNLAHHLLAPGTKSVSPDNTAQIQLTSPQQKTSSFTPNSNWPSPLVNPSHPPKRRKSLAAIELPTFTKLGARG